MYMSNGLFFLSEGKWVSSIFTRSHIPFRVIEFSFLQFLGEGAASRVREQVLLYSPALGPLHISSNLSVVRNGALSYEYHGV